MIAIISKISMNRYRRLSVVCNTVKYRSTDDKSCEGGIRFERFSTSGGHF